MAIEKTPNYNLNKPDYDEFADIEKLNENFDIIDEKIKEAADAVGDIGNVELPNLDTDDKELGGAINEINTKVNQHLEQNDAHTVEQISGLRELLDNTTADTSSLQSNLLGLAIELEMLIAAELTGVDSNVFIETFQNVDDLTILNGAYNSVRKCMEV